MKNILNIARYDLKKITGSVVAIITIMGLCLVPCSYAWFNILSNWAPYELEATGRIAVAVANADEGATVAGVTVNVGDKIVDALKANDDIGWVFVESDSAAKKGVRSGKYYAALVVPENFSRDVLSFSNGDLTNPKLKYYENEKKNAIAPKITGKAEQAVREEVNAAFVETRAGYVSDAASVAEATGADPTVMLADLAEKVDSLARDIQSCIILSQSAASLTVAAGGLMDASGSLIDSTQGVLDQNDKLLDDLANAVPQYQADTKVRDAAAKLAEHTKKNMDTILTGIEAALAEPDGLAYDAFIAAKPANMLMVKTAQDNATTHANNLSKAGYTDLAANFTQLSTDLGTVYSELDALSTDMSTEERTAALEQLKKDIEKVNTDIDTINELVKTDIESDLAKALSNTKKSIANYRTSLKTANSDLGSLSKLMSAYGGALGDLEGSVNKTTASLKALQNGAGNLSGILSGAAGNELLQKLMDLMGNDESAVAEYLSNPIKMDTEVIWPVENYGSAMSPFYTVLAQWVGALLTAVLIKVKVKKRDDLVNLKLHESFFGRYGVYLLIGITQGLVVALGDLLYVRIQCQHPLLFVLAACVNGMVFMMVNYALVFALDNIGMALGVIFLVLQVAGSGGTYPIEVLPPVFKAMYPFMPFRYSMDAMRECIAGMYDGIYWKCLGILMIFFVVSILFGLAFYRPALWLNNLIAESKAKSEIML